MLLVPAVAAFPELFPLPRIGMSHAAWVELFQKWIAPAAVPTTGWIGNSGPPVTPVAVGGQMGPLLLTAVVKVQPLSEGALGDVFRGSERLGDLRTNLQCCITLVHASSAAHHLQHIRLKHFRPSVTQS